MIRNTNNRITLGKLFESLELSFEKLEELNLDKNSEFALAELASAGADDFVFVGDNYLMKSLNDSRAGLHFVSESLMQKIPADCEAKKIISLKNAKLAFAKTTQLFSMESDAKATIAATAFVAESTKVAQGVSIGHNASIGENCTIGAKVVIGANVSIADNVIIGEDSRIYPNVSIYEGTEIGSRVRIHSGTVIGSDGFGYEPEFNSGNVTHQKIIHSGRVLISDDVEIGACTSIDRGTIGDTLIGAGTKIDNQVQIAHNCKIGKNVILCGSTGLAGSAIIDDLAMVGGSCAVNNKTRIGIGAKVSGSTSVVNDVPDGETLIGVPAAYKRNTYVRINMALEKLPEMYKAFKKFTKYERKI